MLSNIVECSCTSELVKREIVREDITVFRGILKFDNLYFNHHIEANQVNFSPFSRFKLRTPGLHYCVIPNVDLDTVIKSLSFEKSGNKLGLFGLYLDMLKYCTG